MYNLFKKRMERMEARIERLEMELSATHEFITEFKDDLVSALKILAKDKLRKDAEIRKDKLMEKAEEKGYYHARESVHGIDPRDITISAISDGKVSTISTKDDDDIKQAYVRGHRRGSRHKKRYRMVNSKGF